MLPDTAKARSRRLSGDCLTKLLKALNANTAWYLGPRITLAVETGMRRGELISIRWQDVDWNAHTVSILKTKNGHPRTIPLTPKALKTLTGIPKTAERVEYLRPLRECFLCPLTLSVWLGRGCGKGPALRTYGYTTWTYAGMWVMTV
jgi:integrase